MSQNIRNFCIIAHIDHGKSTLADRLLDFTGSVSDREKQDQLLDDMDLERERGITIKSHAVQMDYEAAGEKFVLNLIDTPGHVDFSYEVSRAIAACEGALLVVDAAQSIQAQTISNLYLAVDNDLEIIPVVNKIDLPSANTEVVVDEIVSLIGCKPDEVILASAKTGEGIEDIIKGIIDRVPSPEGTVDAPLQALIFDSVFNPYRGIETYFKVVNGKLSKGDKVRFISTGKAKEMRDEYGLDGAMIGRATIGNPWFFDQVKHYLKTGDKKQEPTIAERAEMAIRHLKMAVEWKGEVLGVLETRRHYGNYFKGIANFKDTKSRILNEKNPETIIKELEGVKKNFSEVVLY